MNSEELTPNGWVPVDEYLSALFADEDASLDHARRASEVAGLPAIAVSPLYGRLLNLLAKSMGASTVLELGTLGGYSTIWLARALPSDGLLITIEADPRHADVAQANLDHAGVSDRVRIERGTGSDIMPRLHAQGAGPFDLVFLDADKETLADYLGWALDLCRPGGLIIADNVVRGGKVIDETSDDPMVRGVRRFLDRCAAEPRLETTVLQTVGVKGYDGLAISRVLE